MTLPSTEWFLICFALSCGLVGYHVLRSQRLQMLIWLHVPVDDSSREVTLKHRDGSILKYEVVSYSVWAIFRFQLAIHIKVRTPEYIEQPWQKITDLPQSVKRKSAILHCYIWSDSMQKSKYRKLLCYLYNA